MQKYFRHFAEPTILAALFQINYCLIFLSLILCFSLVETGCSQISLTKKARHNLIPDTAGSRQPSVPSTSSKAINLSGQWNVGFRWRGATTVGMMSLTQSGQNFSGYGKDSENGPAFKIDRGTVKGNDIIFLKRYENDPGPPVQYHGQFSFLPGDNGAVPYMGGEFAREINGNMLAGDWEATLNQPENARVAKEQLRAAEAPAANEDQTNQQTAPTLATALSHPPDLSGKWEVAFEYNFKIIHSTMFLEQEGSKLSGHGIDKDTGCKFTIKNGWYNFPHASFTRIYVPAKKASRACPGHEMTFKADVTMVNDNDYQGPYLSGKTQGGGSWEGQRAN